jgi:hypothetical protein
MNIFQAKIDFGKHAIQSIIITNIILIILAFILEWSIGELILMFWIENIILGLYGILKIDFFRGKPEEDEMTIREPIKIKSGQKIVTSDRHTYSKSTIV